MLYHVIVRLLSISLWNDKTSLKYPSVTSFLFRWYILNNLAFPNPSI